MKKNAKLFIGVLLILTLLFSFSACGTNSVQGTYAPYSMEGKVMGINISIVFGELTDEERESFGEFEQMTLEITKDEVIVYSENVEIGRGKYRLEDDKIIPLDDNGQEEPMDIDGIVSITVDGNNLIMAMAMSESGMAMNFTITFKKEK